MSQLPKMLPSLPILTLDLIHRCHISLQILLTLRFHTRMAEHVPFLPRQVLVRGRNVRIRPGKAAVR